MLNYLYTLCMLFDVTRIQVRATKLEMGRIGPEAM